MKDELDHFLDTPSIFKNGQAQEHKPLSSPNMGSRKPLETLMLFDGASVDGDKFVESHYKLFSLAQAREISALGNEAHDTLASKKPKLDLELSLGLTKDAESLQRSPSSHQSPRSHPSEIHIFLEKSSQASGSICSNDVKHMTSNSHKGYVNCLEDDDKTNSVKEKHSQNQSGVVGFEASEQGRSSNPNNNLNQTQTNLGKNKENLPMGGLRPETKSKFWAWVSIIFTHFERSVGNELEDYLEPSMKKLMTAYLSTKIVSSKKTCDKMFEYQNKKLRLKKIAGLLWAINSQILHIFGTAELRIDYIEQQSELQEWFLRFLRKHKGKRSMLQTKGNANPEWLGMNEIKIYQKVITAVNAESDIIAYQLYQHVLTKDPILVSKPNILINEAVVAFLAFYYRIVKEKWEDVFSSDFDFIYQLTNIENMMKHRDFKQLKEYKEQNSRMEPHFLMSYEKTSLEGFFNLAPNVSHYVNSHYMKPIYQEKHIDEMPKLQITIDFNSQNQVEERWAWISRVKLSQKKNFNKSFQPLSEIIIKEVKNYLIKFSQTYSSTEVILKVQESSEEKIFELLNQIFDITWVLNEQTLNSFGCELVEDYHINEQKSVQMFFMSCFSEFKGKNSSDSQESNKYEIDDDKMINERIAKLVLDALTLDENSDRFTVSPMARNNDKMIIQQVDLIIGQIVVNILGYYYKNQNHKKYMAIFERDTWFFQYLMSMSSKLFYSAYKKNSEYSKILQENRIIPWKENLTNVNIVSQINYKLGSHMKHITQGLKSFVIPVHNYSE
ncbi:hypothetical protein PGT21_018190 [Puccinia graminis f. sp. tritici]|nr:hypothetical protein PGT21_018190 [Puccinia graminis f. sp. tritici]KAA1136595.1 hypothetical protein PGTUg99_036142 [Puccinia graminis f. sp. tritici]